MNDNFDQWLQSEAKRLEIEQDRNSVDDLPDGPIGMDDDSEFFEDQLRLEIEGVRDNLDQWLQRTGKKRRSKNDRKRGRRRRGVVCVEFAFLAPVLLVVFLGAFSVGQGFAVRHDCIVAAGEVVKHVTHDVSQDNAARAAGQKWADAVGGTVQVVDRGSGEGTIIVSATSTLFKDIPIEVRRDFVRPADPDAVEVMP
jgi:hypothetical protein